MTDLDVAALRAGIPALQEVIYLNSGSAGPLPSSVAARMHEVLAREIAGGPASPPVMHGGMSEMVAAKQSLARLLNAHADELALTQNATQGLTIVAAGYPWQPGDEVITTDQEHVSGLVPWYALERHRGVRVRLLPVSEDPDALVRAADDAIGPSTRLLAFSHVAYCTGLRLPVERLCRLARERGVLSAVDGAQAVGQIPVDLHALGADFYALPGQKWLLGPGGTGAFYARAESLERLQPPALGWASVAHYDLEGGYEPHASARRFETASMSAPLAGGLRAAADLALENGVARLERRIAALASFLKARLAAIPGVEVITPRDPGRSAGLVCLALAGADAEWVAQWLWRERRIICRSVPHPYCLRFSVHAFNTEGELEVAARAMAEALAAA